MTFFCYQKKIYFCAFLRFRWATQVAHFIIVLSAIEMKNSAQFLFIRKKHKQQFVGKAPILQNKLYRDNFAKNFSKFCLHFFVKVIPNLRKPQICFFSPNNLNQHCTAEKKCLSYISVRFSI